MREIINIGKLVDDGSGDYLRKGGIKINDNFNELYGTLGDGNIPFAAGAWQTIDSNNTQLLSAAFGSSYSINTQTAPVTVNLPKGSSSDYGKVIKMRDVWASWQANYVLITPAQGDTIKGNGGSVQLQKNYQDIELVYCSPGRWEYIATKQVDKITNSNISSVIKKEFIATDGQTDFLNIFGENEYNDKQIEVYHRGNLLYYGINYSDQSDFGSPGNGTDVVALDRKNIRLKQACKDGDTVIVVSYLDGLGQFRTTYNKLSVSILDVNQSNKTSVNGGRVVDDLQTLNTITMQQLGHLNGEAVNANAFEVYINGVIQTEAGTADIIQFRCDGAKANSQADCISGGGNWVQNLEDYTVYVDDSNSVESITFAKPFNHGDILSVRWYNNDIGTTRSMDEILAETSSLYVSKGSPVQVTGDVRITNFNNPGWPNIETNPPSSVDLATANTLFDLIYPVGTIYENSVNPNNPATYLMGGQWKLFGTKRVMVGWTDDETSQFAFNNNDLDTNGNASKTAGRTGGVSSISIDNTNLPNTATDSKVLVVDKNGAVIVGGCQFDPTDEGPAYTKYREDTATTNITNQPPKSIDIMNPFITVYRWHRVA